MPERGRRDSQGRGCTPFVVVFVLGGLLGGLLALGLAGLGPGYLIGRVTGSAPPLVAATVAPTAAPAIQGAMAPGRRMLWRAPIALDSDTRDPDLLLISRNYDRGGDSIVYLSPDGQSVRWESAPLGENGNSWSVAYDADMIYVADELRLLGLGRDDGALRWEAPLSDKIVYSVCEDCLQARDGVVVALSADGLIQAFAGATGAPRWTVRLRYATDRLIMLGDMVGAPDKRPDVDDSSGGLYLFNIADGAPARAIEPFCARPADGYTLRPSYHDEIYRSADGTELFWLIDSADCIVRASASGLSAGGPIYLSEGFGLTWIEGALFAEEGTYFFDDGRVRVVDAAGERELLASEGYSLRPLASAAGTMVLEARRERGTARLELWAIDTASGQRRWERVLAGTDPVGGAYDTGDWAVALAGDALTLVERRGEPEALVYELLGLSDGVSRASATLAVDEPGDDLHSLTMGGGALFLASDELYAIEPGSGRLLYRWP